MNHSDSLSRKNDIAAVIYLASEGLLLNISEISGDQINIIEHLEYPIYFGQDSFLEGKINFEKVEKTCKILSGFKKLIREYGVKKVQTVATTALREASNSQLVVDQIFRKTRIKVRILDDSEEKSYMYREMLRIVGNESETAKSNLFLAYIGTGSLGTAVFSKGNVVFSQNIRIGSVKLMELLGTLQKRTEQFYLVANEYLSSFSHSIKSLIPFEKFDNFMASGRELEIISNLCKIQKKGTMSFITVKSFLELFDEVKTKTPMQISKKFQINETRAQIILPFMTIYKMLLEIAKADSIVVVPASLNEALLFEMLSKSKAKKMRDEFEKNTVISAWNIGKRFFFDEDHARKVELFSLLIFDEIKRIHGMGKRERLLLQIASMLHDVGKYINIKKHYLHSYNIIRGSEFLGLSPTENEIIATIARMHSELTVEFNSPELKPFAFDERLVIAKLLSILRIADSLDRAHSSKLDDINIKLKKEELTISISGNPALLLEEWAFSRKREFFQEIFGIPVTLSREVKSGI